MAQALTGTILGIILGLVIGGIISSNCDRGEYYHTGIVICLVIAVGSGAIAGAIVGGTAAIVDAIRRGKPPP